MPEKSNALNLSTSDDSVQDAERIPEYTSPLAALEHKRAVPQYGPPKQMSIPDNRRLPPVTIDPSLPPEIAAMFKTNVCKLCEVKLNSRIQSKSHYDGKPHTKKVRMKVDELKAKENAANPNSSFPKELSPPPLKKKKITEDKSQLYCKCCDVSFTSTDHATQHYLGRNHQRVLHGLKPLKHGYYNKDTGKWQRMPPDPRTPTEQIASCDSSNAITYQPKGKFYCELCEVSTTSQEQLDAHFKGHKHTKKTQQRGAITKSLPISENSQETNDSSLSPI